MCKVAVTTISCACVCLAMDDDFDNLANSDRIGDDQKFVDDQLELNYLGGDLSADLANDLVDNLADNSANDSINDSTKNSAKYAANNSSNHSANNSQRPKQSTQTDVNRSESDESKDESASSRTLSSKPSESVKQASRQELSKDESSRDNQLDYETDASMRSDEQRQADESSKDDQSSRDDGLSKDDELTGKAATDLGLPDQVAKRRQDDPNGEQTDKLNGSVVNDPVVAGSGAGKSARESKPTKKEKSILIVHLLNGGKFECPVTVSVSERHSRSTRRSKRYFSSKAFGRPQPKLTAFSSAPVQINRQRCVSRDLRLPHPARVRILRSDLSRRGERSNLGESGKENLQTNQR